MCMPLKHVRNRTILGCVPTCMCVRCTVVSETTIMSVSALSAYILTAADVAHRDQGCGYCPKGQYGESCQACRVMANLSESSCLLCRGGILLEGDDGLRRCYPQRKCAGYHSVGFPANANNACKCRGKCHSCVHFFQEGVTTVQESCRRCRRDDSYLNRPDDMWSATCIPAIQCPNGTIA